MLKIRKGYEAKREKQGKWEGITASNREDGKKESEVERMKGRGKKRESLKENDDVTNGEEKRWRSGKNGSVRLYNVCYVMYNSRKHRKDLSNCVCS